MCDKISKACCKVNFFDISKVGDRQTQIDKQSDVEVEIVIEMQIDHFYLNHYFFYYFNIHV